jgi:hypothetical protein
MTAERDGLVAAGTDVLDEGVERIDRFLEAARERVSALVDRLLDENERLGRRLAAAERVAAAQAEIAESLLDRVEGDVLEAVATDPALAAPAPAPVVSASASLADRLAKRRDFRQDPDMRGWT